MIKSTLETLGLDLKKVSALSADNTNANFGRHNSLYSNLTTQNKNILKANCHARILHNAVR